jgi:hypothetical protein
LTYALLLSGQDDVMLIRQTTKRVGSFELIQCHPATLKQEKKTQHEESHCCIRSLRGWPHSPTTHVTSLAQLIDVALTTPTNGDTLTFDGPSGKWVNKPASAASNGPQIVARFDQEGITGDINAPLFTAPETATYRVTFYGNVCLEHLR